MGGLRADCQFKHDLVTDICVFRHVSFMAITVIVRESFPSRFIVHDLVAWRAVLLMVTFVYLLEFCRKRALEKLAETRAKKALEVSLSP